MRPIFAIAPLAIVLALIGPTPPDVGELLAEFKKRLLPASAGPALAGGLPAEAPLASAFAASSAPSAPAH